MAPLRVIFGLAALCVAGRAHASCPIKLEGDADLAAQITGELGEFPADGAPCVALRVVCSAHDGGLAIELHDELGGDALRTFESPAGAAAFLVSWSRRPVALTGTAAPIVVAVAAPIVEARPPGIVTTVVAPPAAPRHGWGPEVRASVLVSPDTYFGSLDLGWLKTSGDRQWGLVLRALTGPTTYEPYSYDWLYDNDVHRAYVGTQAEAIGRFSGPRLGAISTRLELAAGGTLITRVSRTWQLATSTYGIHEGARVAAAWPVIGGLALEAGVGVDVLWQATGDGTSPVGTSPIVAYPHAEIGLRWAP